MPSSTYTAPKSQGSEGSQAERDPSRQTILTEQLKTIPFLPVGHFYPEALPSLSPLNQQFCRYGGCPTLPGKVIGPEDYASPPRHGSASKYYFVHRACRDCIVSGSTTLSNANIPAEPDVTPPPSKTTGSHIQ